MNAYLKEIADLCGISKKLTTHAARHIFATTLTLSNYKEFQIRTYSFGELAQLYFPQIAKPSVSRMFSQWIHTYPQLLQKFVETNWNKRSKYFTPKQVKLLVGHFDPPF